MTKSDSDNNKKSSFINIPSLEDHHYYLFTSEFDNSSTGSLMSFIIQRNLMEVRPDHIKLILNTPGGDVPAAFALIDTMKGSAVPIHTYGLGQIASCGLLTFIAGAKGHRYITENTQILSHQYTWGSFGKEHELFAQVREFNNVSDRILRHYQKCTGLTEKRIKEILLPPEDVFLTAKEAVKYGIADKIVSFY